MGRKEKEKGMLCARRRHKARPGTDLTLCCISQCEFPLLAASFVALLAMTGIVFFAFHAFFSQGLPEVSYEEKGVTLIYFCAASYDRLLIEIRYAPLVPNQSFH